MSTRKIRILLVMRVSRNLGDAIIAENARFLIQKALGVFGRRKCEILGYDLNCNDLTPLQFADCIVFDGGGLIRFKTESAVDSQIVAILNEANRLSIPVFFNAVGVEGYEEDNERCQALKAALRLPCVKEISCRDDIGTLQKDYVAGSSVKAVPVFDPAIWTAETYPEISRQPLSGTIGVGIARSDIFTDYGAEGIDHDFLLKFWTDIIDELDRTGYNWAIFTNGLDSDEKFAEEVLAAVGHGTKVPQPAESEDLIRTIRSFGGIIACRMHANTIAYSMGIPGVGLVWNDKLTLWGYKIGHPERFLQPEMFDPEFVVATLERAIQTGCSPVTKEEKNSSLQELKAFLNEYAVIRKGAVSLKDTPVTDYRSHLVAPALGGIHHIYRDLDSLGAFDHSVARDFKYLEADVRLTSDPYPALIHGWNEETYAKLGLTPVPVTDADGNTVLTCPPVPMEQFRELRYYGKWPATPFVELIKKIQENPKYFDPKDPKVRVRVILDVGEPSPEDFRNLLGHFKEVLDFRKMNPELFLLRIPSMEDWKVFQDFGLAMEPVFGAKAYKSGTAEEKRARLMQTVEACKAEGVTRISVPAELWDDVSAKVIHENGLKAVVFSYQTIGDVFRALELGADLVGSHFDSPKRLTDMTKA